MTISFPLKWVINCEHSAEVLHAALVCRVIETHRMHLNGAFGLPVVAIDGKTLQAPVPPRHR